MIEGHALAAALLVGRLCACRKLRHLGGFSSTTSSAQQYMQPPPTSLTRTTRGVRGTFASATCLDTLMKQGEASTSSSKPPSLDTILNMVKNFACEQAEQTFDKLLGGSGLLHPEE